MTDNNLAGLVGDIQKKLGDKVNALQQEMSQELEAVKHAAARAGSGSSSGGDGAGELVDFLKSIASGQTQAELLQALVQAASHYLPRVMLLIRKGNNLHGWSGFGFEESFLKGGLKRVRWTIESFAELISVVNQKVPLVASFNDLSDISNDIEKFDGFTPFKSAFFPLVVKGKVAAVLYADSGDNAQLSNVSVAEILCYLTGVELTLVTTKLKVPGENNGMSPAAKITPAAKPAAPPRAAQAPPVQAAAPVSPAPAAPQPAPVAAAPVAAAPAATTAATGTEDPAVKKAKRVARVLVSDLKLYNEDAVNKGSANGDLYSRLKEDLDRSYKHYKERIADLTLTTDANYFKEELIRQLGDGNPNALGPLPF